MVCTNDAFGTSTVATVDRAVMVTRLDLMQDVDAFDHRSQAIEPGGVP